MQARVSPTIPFGVAKQNCYLCEGAQRTHGGVVERMIDTGVHVDFEGHIAICETCIGHMGKLLGLFTPDDVENLVVEARELLEQNTGHEQNVERQRGIIEAQRVALADALGLSPEEAFPEYGPHNLAPAAAPNGLSVLP